MTPEQFKQACALLPPEVSWGDILTPSLMLDIRAQARAELIAELKPTAYLPQADIDELRKSGRRAAVLYNERVSHLDAPLAIIPKE